MSRGQDGQPLRPGPAPARTAARPPGVSRPALRRFFAPGTPASATAAPGRPGGPPADVDELAAALGDSSSAADVVAVELAAAALAGGETEASSRSGTAAAGPDVEPDARPPGRGHRRVVQRVDVPAGVARANPSTLPPGDPFSVWR